MPRKSAADWALSAERSSPPRAASDEAIEPGSPSVAPTHWSTRLANLAVRIPLVAKGNSLLAPSIGRGRLPSTDALAGLIRYAAMGGLATVVYFVSAVGLSLAGLGPQLTSAAAIVISVIASFVMHSRVTFQTDGLALSKAARFSVIGVTGLVASRLLVDLIHVRAGLPFVVAVLAVCAAVPVANFAAMNFWVFADARRRAK